jgi:hypothetical protein
MAIMTGDVISTPEGKAKIDEIKTVRINQHSFDKVYFFSNGCTARQRITKLGAFPAEMIFKPSEPISAWCRQNWSQDEN